MSLNFSYHIKEKMSKVIKGTGIIKKIHKIFPQHPSYNIEKIWMHQFFARQKADMPRAHKMAAGAWGAL